MKTSSKSVNRIIAISLSAFLIIGALIVTRQAAGSTPASFGSATTKLSMPAGGGGGPVRFAVPTTVPLLTASSPYSAAVADINGDGKPDMVTANGELTGSISVFLNTTAAGTWTPTFLFPV